jgi:hypothetical protein
LNYTSRRLNYVEFLAYEAAFTHSSPEISKGVNGEVIKIPSIFEAVSKGD